MGSIFHDCADTALHLYQDRLNFSALDGLGDGKMERTAHATTAKICSLLQITGADVKVKFNKMANAEIDNANVERKRLSLIATPSLPIRGRLSAP